MASQFSNNGKYFALLSNEGKLQIWNTSTSKLEQEFVPNYHLTCPCTCLHFVETSGPQSKGTTPKKKKRKNPSYYVLLGTNTGLLVGYSIASASVVFDINSNSNQSVLCLSWDGGSLMYAGVEEHIFIFDLQENISNKWKSGTGKINAIKVINNDKLLTASKSIKLWDIASQELLKTFVGHSSDVCIMEYISPRQNSCAYFITGSKGDRLLSCWSLNLENEDSNAVATFLMDDVTNNVAICQSDNEVSTFAGLTRGGNVYIYRHTLNGKSSGPLKPKTVLQVASNPKGYSKEVTQIPIEGVSFQDENNVLICHGSQVDLTFETVIVTYKEKLQCLVRSAKTSRQIQNDTQENAKIRRPIVDNNVQYLTTQTGGSTTKRKADGKYEMPMEQRLENLMLTKSDSKVPQGANLSQLLIQGIHSKDKNILRTVLMKHDDEIVSRTVKRLPIAAIAPLLQELSEFVVGQTVSCSIAALWIKHVLRSHSSVLLANPKFPELLVPIAQSIESRLSLQQSLGKLHGRLDLLMSQVNRKNSPDDEDEPILSYVDKDSSDSEVDGMEVMEESSQGEWSEEESEEGEGDQEPNQENNVSSTDEEEDMST